MPIRDKAINVFIGLQGDGDRLELTYNFGIDSYELGTGYGHIAVTVDDLDGTLERLADQGIEPERPPYQVREGGSRLCFVRDRISTGSSSSSARTGRRGARSASPRVRGDVVVDRLDEPPHCLEPTSRPREAD